MPLAKYILPLNYRYLPTYIENSSKWVLLQDSEHPSGIGGK